MRFAVVLFCLAALSAGQQLRVKGASARSVQLEWDGAAGPVTVERANGSAFQKIAPAAQANYTDASIDPFATYRYRISAGGKFSNEVIVGPPPAGVLNAAPVPKGTEPPKYGAASAVGLDENGDPMIAFEWLDPNGDGNGSDNDVRFVHWSRASRKWLPPVRAQVVGEILSQGVNPISLACDRKTSLLAIVTPVGEGGKFFRFERPGGTLLSQQKGVSFLVSKDGGATWNGTPIPGIATTVNSTAIEIVDGIAHVVLGSTESEAYYLTGPVENVSSWKRQNLPAADGWKRAESANIGLTIDTAGKPVIAWYEAQTDGDGRRFQVWRPGGQTVTAVDTKKSADNPDLAIAAGGGQDWLVV